MGAAAPMMHAFRAPFAPGIMGQVIVRTNGAANAEVLSMSHTSVVVSPIVLLAAASFLANKHICLQSAFFMLCMSG